MVQLDPVNLKSQGERKMVRLAGIWINGVKISSKALQGKWTLLQISKDFKLSEFKLLRSNC